MTNLYNYILYLDLFQNNPLIKSKLIKWGFSWKKIKQKYLNYR